MNGYRYPNSDGALPTNGNTGINLSLWPVIENPVIQYEFDGTERHAERQDLDAMAVDFARRIEWRNFLGPDDTLEPLCNLRNISLTEQSKAQQTEDEKQAKHDEKVRDLLMPQAGPWASVAKNLHDALSEVNNLLDVIRIVKDGNGLVVGTVTPNLEDSLQSIGLSKAYTWMAYRKALLETKATFLLFLSRKNNNEMELFYRELRELRKYYLVRKAGDQLVGDLGYRVYGPTWVGSQMFDIYRIEENKRSRGIAHNDSKVSTMLEVDVPKHLAVRSSIVVSIAFDCMDENLFEKRVIKVVKRPAQSNQSFGMQENSSFVENQTPEDEEDAEARGMKPNLSRMAYWKNALRWSRDTLFYRDIFTQLTRECAQIEGRCCNTQDDIILVSLFDNVMLKIEKCESPFVDGDLTDLDDVFLKGMLKCFYLDQVNKPTYRPPIFASLPNTTMSQSAELEGCLAQTEDEIAVHEVTPPMLIEKMVSVTSHYYLITTAIRELTSHQTQNLYGPTLTWRWQRTSPTNSVLMVTMACKGFEFVPKHFFRIRVNEEGVEIFGKDNHKIRCRRDHDLFVEQLHTQAAQYWMLAVSMLAMRNGFQTIQSLMNEYDADDRLSPTILMVNSCSTRKILVQLKTNGDPPKISTRTVLDRDPTDEPDKRPFTVLQYDRLPGNSFLKKLEVAMAYLRY